MPVSKWMATSMAILLVLALSACGNGVKAGTPDSPTGGIALEVLRTDERSSHALYRIDPDGLISFGGGFDALQDRVTWSVALTAEQLSTLRALLDAHGWFDGPPHPDQSDAPPPQDAPAEPAITHRIVFASPVRSWKATIEGGSIDLDPIVAFLRDVTLARHEQLLDSFPQPSQPVPGD